MSAHIRRGTHRRTPRHRILRQVLTGGLVGVLGLGPATASAWARDQDPPPSPEQSRQPNYSLGSDREAYGTDARSGALDGDPWEPEPQEEADGDPEADADEEPLEGPPSTWAKPLTVTGRVSAAYGVPGNWIAGHHTGIDLAVRPGTPVYAVGSGVVVRAGWGGDYGLIVLMRMDDRRYTLFAHLSKIVIRPGTRVKAGSLLGFSGNTGKSSGPHLHFEVRTSAKYGSDIDPVSYLASKGVRL
ncbi:M23 family metallopeptidase [Streptomyces sp. KR80]|uniref:M23 family metallopeptidase n=1 Tax=Streptomyces sp. KR80 TaxID=3457426 RepID=UPI003FD1DB4B